MTAHTTTSTDRTARLNMRVSPEALDLVREAAAAQQQDVTSFVLGAAMERSRTVLMEQRVLSLTARETAQITESLDREAQVIPELAALIGAIKESRIKPQSPART